MLNEFFLKYGGIIYLIQFAFAVIIGLYFWNQLKGQQSKKNVIIKESERESFKLRSLRNIRLSEPLASVTKPSSLTDVIGQEEGIAMLKSALCCANPQHVIIYGPPGIGKTAAARLVLQEAKRNPSSPFISSARFVEIDATITRFDERSIADPLIGSVHDPIYQGAGAMGQAGIPQPKLGACTKAHGGVLFIDEIGELHNLQMNKLLKVLEDRKVILESAYYSESDNNIPRHIHDIFTNGLPADFRLVGATTRSPEELPPALRSRCMEIFFKPLEKNDISIITANAVNKISMQIDDKAMNEICKHASNGREAVNIVQLSAGMTQMVGAEIITGDIVERVLNNGRFTPRFEPKLRARPAIGFVNGLAVQGAGMGSIIEVEASCIQVDGGRGKCNITGVIDEEVMESGSKKFTRKSMARAALENAIIVLRSFYKLNFDNLDVHINFPGGIPVDGPSAGISMVTALYSSIMGREVDNTVAMTGEISVHGIVKPVGGVIAKVEAARKAGISKVIIPEDNWLSIFDQISDMEIIPVNHIEQVIKIAIGERNIIDNNRVQAV